MYCLYCEGDFEVEGCIVVEVKEVIYVFVYVLLIICLVFFVVYVFDLFFLY